MKTLRIIAVIQIFLTIGSIIACVATNQLINALPWFVVLIWVGLFLVHTKE